MDQATKLNYKIRTVEQNNEFIDVKKANRKFISKDQAIKQEEKDVGFREDVHKEKIIDIEEQPSNFEKEFFGSFKKGPYNKTDILEEEYDENQQEGGDISQINSNDKKKSKKNMKKQKSIMENSEEDERPVDFGSKNIF